MRADSRRAIAEGWPILLTVSVAGLAFGLAARQNGLSVAEAAGMSLFIFAGASQFAAAELAGRGAPAPLIVATVLFVNLRHLLMAVSLRPHLATITGPRRLLAAYVLTDEAFAMGIREARRGGRGAAFYLTFAVALWSIWNLATLAGAALASGTIDAARFGLDYAIAGTFIAIVVLGVRGRPDVAVALAAALIAAALRLAGFPLIATIAAGALAPLVAVAWRER